VKSRGAAEPKATVGTGIGLSSLRGYKRSCDAMKDKRHGGTQAGKASRDTCTNKSKENKHVAR